MTDVEPRRFRFAPRLPPHFSARERLLAQIDAAADQPLTIVRAPGGGGKTALLASWAHRRDRPGFWVTVDESTGSRLAFWQHVIGIALDSGLIPERSILKDIVMGDDIAPVLRSALVRGFSALDDPLVLVLDDYQLVTDERVHDDLHALLVGHEHLTVLLGTRTRTPLEEIGRTARLATTVIGPGDLLFTEEETVSVAREAGVGPEAGAALHTAFGGWPIATQAALLEFTAGRAATLDEGIERVQDEGIARMLSSLDSSPYMLFLLRTSIAPRLSPELAADLGGADAALHLERAEREGLGTFAPTGARLEFAYQPLLRSHLEAELERRLPGELPELRAVYGRERSLSGDPVTAMRQFAAIGDWGAVVEVVQRHYATVVRVLRTEAREVFERARPGDLRRHPILLVMLALMRNAEDAPKDRVLQLVRLGIAFTRARLGVGDPVERVWMLAALNGVQRIGGRYQSALETSEALLATMRSLDDDQRARLYGRHAMMLSLPGSVRFLTGRLPGALESFTEAQTVAEAMGDEPSRLYTSSLRLATLALRGQHEALLPRLKEARERIGPFERGVFGASGFHYAEAFAALESFDTEAALAQISELAAHEHTSEHWPLIVRIRALAALTGGRHFEGLHRLAQDVAAHDDRPPTSRYFKALLAVTRSDLLLAEGEPARAKAALDAVGRSWPEVATAAARVALAMNRPERAISLVSRLAWSDDAPPRPQAEAFLAIAIAAHRTGRAEEARTAIRRGVGVLKANALQQPLMMLARPELSAVLSLADLDSGAILQGVPDLFPAVSLAGDLTAGELRVLAALDSGRRIDELAGELFLSPNTVKTHLRSVYRKLGVASRDEAVIVAHLRGMLPEGKAEAVPDADAPPSADTPDRQHQ